MNVKRSESHQYLICVVFVIVGYIDVSSADQSNLFSLSGGGLSLCVAGVPTWFRVVSKDGALETAKSKLIMTITSDDRQLQRQSALLPQDDLDSKFFGSYKITRAGNYQMSILRYICKQLIETFRSFDMREILPERHQSESDSHCAGDGWTQTNGIHINVVFHPLSLSSIGSSVSLRTLPWSDEFQQWDCIFLAEESGEYTVSIIINAEFSQTKSEVFLGNITIYQAGMMRESKSFHLDADVPTNATARVWLPSKALVLSNTTLQVRILVHSNLLRSNSLLSCNFFGDGRILMTNITVNPSTATRSSISYNGSSLLFAGQQAAIVVLAYDQFGNQALFSDMMLRLKGRMESQRGSDIVPALQSPGTVVLGLTIAGTYNIQMALVNSLGLFATYFALDNFTWPSAAQKSTVIDFSSSFGSLPSWSLQAGMPFSIRWAGYVRPEMARVYTFYAGISDADERIRVWIRSSLVVDMWSNLSGTEGSGTAVFDIANGYYDILVEYKQESASAAAARLSWDVNGFKTSIASTNLGSAEPSMGSPLPLKYSPAIATYDQISAQGNSLTISTCCMPNTFAIRGRDRYGNVARFTDDSLRVRIIPSTFAGHALQSNQVAAVGELDQICRSEGIEYCQVHYKCKVSGYFLISIEIISFGALDGAEWKRVQGSPFQLSVLPGLPTEFIVNGNALSLMTAGVASQFRVWSRDCGGNTANLASDSPITLATSHDFKDWRQQIFASTVLGNGIMSISYSVTFSGRFFLSVRYFSLSIIDSPFVIQCLPALLSNASSEIEIESSTATAGLHALLKK